MHACFVLGIVYSVLNFQNADLEKLQGEWVPTRIVRSGRELPEKLVATAGLIVKGNKLRWGKTFIEQPFSDFKIDSCKTSPDIDFVFVEPFGKRILR